jgi:hypothetical protein
MISADMDLSLDNDLICRAGKASLGLIQPTFPFCNLPTNFWTFVFGLCRFERDKDGLEVETQWERVSSQIRPQ